MRNKATIHENGNGLPRIGSLCYDSTSDTVYEVVGWDDSDRISTNGPGAGNSVGVIVEERGSATDVDEDEWSEIERSNYSVILGGGQSMQTS